MTTFKEINFESRKKECSQILEKYPDRIPVIVTIDQSKNIKLDKNKYLVPKELTIGQFLYVLRRRIKLKEEEAMFIYSANSILQTSAIIGDIYEINKGADGFLYVKIVFENSFG